MPVACAVGHLHSQPEGLRRSENFAKFAARRVKIVVRTSREFAVLTQVRAGWQLMQSLVTVGLARLRGCLRPAAGDRAPLLVEALRLFLRRGIQRGARKELALARRDIPATYVPLGLRRRVAHRRHEALGGRPAEVFTARGWTSGHPTMLYLHGGGYVACSPASHRALCATIAEAAQARVYALDYRLAPEHPFPAALDDACDAYAALIGVMQTPASRIVIAGDSSGGGLALATVLRSKAAGQPPPAGIALLSPWLDLGCTWPSIRENEAHCYLVRETLEVYRDHYLQQADPAHPLASPIHADPTGLPPTLVQIGAREMLRDEALAFAARATSVGVDVTLDLAPYMFHAYQTLTPLLPGARAAARRVGQFTTKCVATTLQRPRVGLAVGAAGVHPSHHST